MSLEDDLFLGSMEKGTYKMKPHQPYINQSTQKGGKTRNKMEGPRRQMNHLKGELQGEHQVLEPPLFARSISFKEKGGGPLARMPSLDEP